MKYVAFLRGINVGGHQKISMDSLKKLFSENGFSDVKTLLNTGNVIFFSDEKDKKKLEARSSNIFEKTFGYRISIIVRSMEEIQKLVDSKPFNNIEVTPNTRLYITFLPSKPHHSLQIPYESPEKDLQILKVTDGEVISVVTISEKRNTTDIMSLLDKEFGKDVTTRNWNTIVKTASK